MPENESSVSDANSSAGHEPHSAGFVSEIRFPSGAAGTDDGLRILLVADEPDAGSAGSETGTDRFVALDVIRLEKLLANPTSRLDFDRARYAVAIAWAPGFGILDSPRSGLREELKKVARRVVFVADGSETRIGHEGAGGAGNSLPGGSDQLERLLADLRDEIRDLQAKNDDFAVALSVRETEIGQLRRWGEELESALAGGSRTAIQAPSGIELGPEDPLYTHARNHELTTSLAETIRHARALQQHVDNIESSRGWRLFNVYRRIKDSIIGRPAADPSRRA